jgi:hypothetical protein
MSASAQRQKIRRIVWTGAVASVTATGAWYGAGLKTQQEMKEVRITLLQGTTSENANATGRLLKRDVKKRRRRR